MPDHSDALREALRLPVAAECDTEPHRGDRAPHVEARQGCPEMGAAHVMAVNAVRAHVDEKLAAIDGLVGGLQVSTAIYRDRPVDWGDVASLKCVLDHLGRAVQGFRSAEGRAELSRASREVALEVGRFRLTEQANR